ncbi:TetR/AcrR family transcriptional regulator [Nocardioides carbamazepini]|uniref:TetR/AcrR family transcriptional regulator n=1 Tax=Nocardioides carbamazepini TaxID=2854259 RepID=UPI00214A6FF9|nr:TetR/AcrR family transcriptional regulator [Nocardioides carbamazepini]MCR1784114.1 TetR/AcrR family transcriptional regulator [Nocardioides carbamazepini]
MRTAKTDARHTDTAQRVLDVATELFFTNGYPATSVRQIMQACHVTAGSLYNHFGSKEDVLYAILMRSLNDSVASLQQALRGADDNATTQLRALVGAISIFHSERQLEGLVSQTEWRHLPPERATDVLEQQKRIRRLFEECLERGIADGEFTLAAVGADTDITAKSILDLCINAGKWFRPTGRLGAADLARQHVELVTQMVGATPPRTTSSPQPMP